MGGWAKSGWDGTEAPEKGEGGNRFGALKFWMREGTTKRIMFLDSEPFCFYEHGLYMLTGSGKDTAICLAKNGLLKNGATCPVCDAKNAKGDDLSWAQFLGYFSVIDMGDVEYASDGTARLSGWLNDKGILYQFGRKLLPAKRGSKDKPGMLQEFRRLANKHGGLDGTVWDVYRSGKKTESIGDKYEFVTKVPKEDILKYLTAAGAKLENLDVEPINYDKEFVPQSPQELANIVAASPNVAAGNDTSFKPDKGGNDDFPF